MKIKIFLFTLTCLFMFALNMDAQISLAAGTKITLADDTKKNVEEIKAGDKILVFNVKEKVYEEKAVKGTSKVMLSRLVRITLETGMQVVMSLDNPFFAEKGWVSISPEQTMDDKQFKNIQHINIGEFTLFYNVSSTDYVEVTTIQGILEPTMTYTLQLDGDGGAVVANGFLVGHK
ncbi:hypothetical protein M2451_000154 [Dysgonomonas sp. PFB1-18]|uniref:Hint domain-containing protein n=1 Tax=unclassified Dysgonomonas TaxID=2630389 RepID=UPI002475F07A|nr:MULTISPECIES: Hint domain-containing protein [unclassified Dysgonomonas]MDH6307705.1 hypothetical protein [Dysgonomonas sp. PF1-14]MDH6337623.1 hypothetical protein [Dysgonomonas sp. PF1-16]MDH6378847.1 hypothetical protein [Dysgonomonas sp. PFB1-18]MDH6396482.1 hypothetical protein [Dysgonomonas sp. PF1-23]